MIMRYNREKLLEIAKPYLSDDIDMVYITEDGNVFYQNGKHFAEAHSRYASMKMFEITKSDYNHVSKVYNEEEKSEEEKSLRDKAKGLGIKVPGRASEETIQKLIDEKLADNKN